MPFDTTDAYVAIVEINEKLDFLYKQLIGKGILKEPNEVRTMPYQKRVKGHMMKVKGRRAKVRVRPHLRKVRRHYK